MHSGNVPWISNWIFPYTACMHNAHKFSIHHNLHTRTDRQCGTQSNSIESRCFSYLLCTCVSCALVFYAGSAHILRFVWLVECHLAVIGERCVCVAISHVKYVKACIGAKRSAAFVVRHRFFLIFLFSFLRTDITEHSNGTALCM